MISDPRPMRPSLVSCQRSQNTRLPSLQYMVVLGLIVVLIGAFMEVIKDKDGESARVSVHNMAKVWSLCSLK